MKRSGPPKRRKPLARGTKRLPARSAKAIARQPDRDACRAAVFARAYDQCELAPFIPEVPACGGFTAARPGLEVDELHGGARRSTEQYDPDACRATCPAHHDWKTAHKNTVLERMGVPRWAPEGGRDE